MRLKNALKFLFIFIIAIKHTPMGLAMKNEIHKDRTWATISKRHFKPIGYY